MRYALSNYAVCKMVFHIASEFITYLRTPTNFGKITFSCSVAFAKTKAQISEADQHLCFRYSDSTIPLQTDDFLQFDLSRALHFSARVF